MKSNEPVKVGGHCVAVDVVQEKFFDSNLGQYTYVANTSSTFEADVLKFIKDNAGSYPDFTLIYMQ